MMQVEQVVIEKRRKMIRSHLKRLDQSDRMLRFFSPVKNEVLDTYADSLNDERDVCFAIFNYDRKRIVGLAHVAIFGEGIAELGMSVDAAYRGMGCGQLLMERVALFCKTHKISQLKMECLKENQGMRGLAAKCGAETTSIEDGEVSALAKFNIDFQHRFAAYLKTIQMENTTLLSKTFQKSLIRTRDFLDKMLKSSEKRT